MPFPKVIFGKCPICGSDGGDAPESSLTGADATTDIDEEGNGVELVYYNGDLMCHICRNRKIAEEETRIANDKRNDAESFRNKAGFKHSIE
jgi:hypothetical protein